MKIKTKFKDLFLLKSLKYKDSRGYFKEIIKEKLIKRNFHFSNVFLEKMLSEAFIYKIKILKVNLLLL